jgi:cytochrome c556
MRIAFVAATACLALAACGGPETSQTDRRNTAAPAATASNMTMIAVQPLPRAQALKVMHERHEGMEAIGRHNRTLRRELTSGSPSVAAVRKAAGAIAKLSASASGWFPLGTGPDVAKTGAKPEIWQNQRDFAAKLRNFQLAARTLNAAAAGNDVGAMKARFADLGGACKACHDKYRKEMKH